MSTDFSLRASDLLRDKVLCTNDKKLGEVVNVVFNPELHDARIVVFPEKLTRFDLRGLIDLGFDIGVDALKGLNLPFDEKMKEYVELAINDDTIDKTSEFFKGQIQNYLKDMEDKLREMYFLVPAFEIKESSTKTLRLKDDREKYYTWFNASTSEDDLCYFHEIAYTDSENKFKITLEKGSIRGQIVKDSEGRRGRLSDLVFIPSTCLVTELKVDTVGVGAGQRSIKIEDFNFKEMTSTKPFG